MSELLSHKQPKLKTKSDFYFLRTIGDGSFSTVHLAEEKSTGLKFAIKECDKRQILREKKVKYIHLEKRILVEIACDSPFIIKLCFTFQDDASLYFGLEYCLNGDLLEYLKKFKNEFLNGNLAQFYSAEIVLALEYIHSKNIIHRDVKPENILVDDRRHIKLTDFGTACCLDDESQQHMLKEQVKSERRNSFVGTAQYVSPEILQSKEVHKGSDLWSLGCVIYQLLTDKHCFTGSHEYDIFQKVLSLSYSFPDLFPTNAKDLITRLIKIEPIDRLGTNEQGGYEALKSHEFFHGIKWNGLHEQDAPLS